MSNTVKCVTFKGTYIQMVLPIFAAMTLLIGLIVYMALNAADAALPVIILGFLIFGLLIFFVVKQTKYMFSSMELAENELKFFDKSGQFKYTIPIQDISAIRPAPFLSFDELNAQLIITLKGGSNFTVLVNEEGRQLIEEKFQRNSAYNTESAKSIPVYMHLLFGLSVLILGFVVYILVVVKEPLGIREIGYIAVIGAFISYYIFLRKKLKSG